MEVYNTYQTENDIVFEHWLRQNLWLFMAFTRTHAGFPRLSKLESSALPET